MTFTRRAFTLMEMLLVVSLVAMIGVVIFQSLKNGLRLWEQAQRLNGRQQTAIALDKLGRDLRASVAISTINFYGTQMQVTFPSIVLTAADSHSSRAGEGLIDQIGAVQYRFEPSEGKLYRRQANYGQALKAQWAPDEEVAFGIEELRFSYVRSEKSSDERSSSDHLPAGVWLRLRMKGEAPDQWLSQYFFVPIMQAQGVFGETGA